MILTVKINQMKKIQLLLTMVFLFTTIGAVMLSIFCIGKIQEYNRVAIESLDSEMEVLNSYKKLQEDYMNLQIEHINMLEEYNDYIYINSGQAEADSIHEKI